VDKMAEACASAQSPFTRVLRNTFIYVVTVLAGTNAALSANAVSTPSPTNKQTNTTRNTVDVIAAPVAS